MCNEYQPKRREHFAEEAMKGMLATGDGIAAAVKMANENQMPVGEYVALIAVELADCLIARLDK
jgi:hypothetical protein